jgi:selenocysteine lyase/cysteine desulfurase
MGKLSGKSHQVTYTRLCSAIVASSALRDEFPVLSQLAYLNAGTDGPLPTAAAHASTRELERELQHGRVQQHFDRRNELSGLLRTRYASLLACPPEDVALTTCTSEGISLVLTGLDLQPGDEILTSDEEHPGLLGALAAARDIHGVSIRTVALADVADSVGPQTKLVACSHVGWVSGSVAPTGLAAVSVPVLLDGAQGVGAVPVDVGALGCAAYAGAGQKWLCGPDGTGMLYVSPELRERLAVGRRGYANLADPGAGLEAQLHEDARRFDSLALSAEAVACAVAAFDVLQTTGWAAIHERSRRLAERLVELLVTAGRQVAPRGATTLVSFSSSDPPAERLRLAEGGVLLRDIPDRPWLRASVGAWNDERDLERLIDLLSG